MAKLYENVCVQDGSSYISYHKYVICDDCKSICNPVREFDESDINEEVLSMIKEGGEGKEKPKIRIVYRDGKRTVIKKRKVVNKIPSQAKVRAAAIARQKAWSEEARLKRRKSITARKEANMLGI